MWKKFFKKRKKENNLINEFKKITEMLKELENLIKNIDTRIGEMAFDNQMFKHQISIEEALRNQESDIRLLKVKIEKTISDLNLENENE